MHYGVDVKRMLLVQMHPTLDNYAVYEVPDLREEVCSALEERRVKVSAAAK